MKCIQPARSVLWLGLALASLGSAQAMAECTLALSSANVDFGTFNRDSLVLDAGLVKLGERTLSLNASCDSESDLTLLYRGTAQDERHFQFGSQGHYQVRVRDATVDGVPVSLGETGPKREAPTHIDRSIVWRPDRGIVPWNGATVVAGKVLQAQIDIIARTPMAALRVRDATYWHAQASIDMAAGGASRELALDSAIMPVSCVPTLSNGGVVNFGTHSVASLNRDTQTTLPPRSVELNVLCDGAVRFALQTVDSRPATALILTPADFSLGTSAGKPVGRYHMAMENVRVQGWSAAYSTQSASAGGSWSASNTGGGELLRNGWLGYNNTLGTSDGPHDFAQLSATIQVTPMIAPVKDLDVRAPVLLDGAAVIEIKYF